VLAVFSFHLSEYLRLKSGLHYGPSPVSDFLARTTKAGAFGVQLFFTISGFILALPFAAHYLEGKPSIDLRRYFLRRLTRLEPPYIINLILVFVLLVLVNGHSASQLFPHLVSSLFYLHNLVFPKINAINVVTWSLEIEVQFYVLAPLIGCIFALPNQLVRRLVFVIGGAVAIALQVLYPPAITSLFSAIQYFLLGFFLVDIYLVDWKREPIHDLRWDLISVLA
jgi:peptidoglycan/LPS O-acetylase OafA/YrhL